MFESQLRARGWSFVYDSKGTKDIIAERRGTGCFVYILCENNHCSWKCTNVASVIDSACRKCCNNRTSERNKQQVQEGSHPFQDAKLRADMLIRIQERKMAGTHYSQTLASRNALSKRMLDLAARGEPPFQRQDVRDASSKHVIALAQSRNPSKAIATQESHETVQDGLDDIETLPSSNSNSHKRRQIDRTSSIDDLNDRPTKKDRTRDDWTFTSAAYISDGDDDNNDVDISLAHQDNCAIETSVTLSTPKTLPTIAIDKVTFRGERTTDLHKLERYVFLIRRWYTNTM